MNHKAGFVNIIGNPNVGKSTLMNALVGENLSIITSKSQTTRHRILGLVNGNDFQIIYSDTPGIIVPAYKLQQGMMKFVAEAFNDADIILYVTDPTDSEIKIPEFEKHIKNTDVPVIIVANKIDLMQQAALEKKLNALHEKYPNAKLIPVSAQEKFNIESLFKLILHLLPNNEPYYPKDELTDKSLRFFTSEMIREKIFLHYDKEIPYSVEVEIESYEEAKDIDRIRAIIYVVRDSQKGIIIGHQGKMLKRVGTEARKDMEHFLGKKVFLELYVKVKKDWKDSERDLKKFGYWQ